MQKLLQFWKQSENRLYILFLLIAFLAYGLVIFDLGLYGDDPAFLSIFHRFGSGGYQDYLGWFRPFAPWIYILITPIFGENIILYHLFLLILRCLSAFLFYHLLKLIWPGKTRALSWAACLLIVYPGFRQQAMPLEFCLHFSTLCLYLGSAILMVWSIKNPKRYFLFTGLALLCGLGIFGIEYFTGLEFLRPLIIAAVLYQNEDKKGWIRRALYYEIPYLILMIAYLVWRLFFLKTGYYQPTVVNQITAAPILTIGTLVGKAFKDLWTAGVMAWTDIYNMPSSGSFFYLYWIAFVLVFLTVFFNFRFSRENIQKDESRWGWIIFGSGLLAMVIGGIPLWSVGLPVELTYPWNRTTLPFMLGSCLVMAAVLEIFFKNKYQSLVFALLVSILVGFNFQTLNTYRKEWDITSNYFWQLTWRAPQLKTETLILADQLPFSVYPDNSLSPLLNWVYDPDNHSKVDHYKYFDLSARRDLYLASLETGTPVEHGDFSGNTSQALVVYSTPGTCLRILTPGDRMLPKISQNLIDSLHLTRFDQIISEPSQAAIPPKFMGTEPAQAWCYYFEKAELAAQEMRWNQVVTLGEEAFAKNLQPTTSSEMAVFIKGYALTQQTSRAIELSEKIIKEDPGIKPYLCDQWAEIIQQDPINLSNEVQSWFNTQKCPSYQPN